MTRFVFLSCLGSLLCLFLVAGTARADVQVVEREPSAYTLKYTNVARATPDGADGSGGCDPCDDACATNKRRGDEAFEDPDDIRVVYGNETTNFRPGEGIVARFSESGQASLEFDCSPSGIPEVCQNMCFGVNCKGFSKTLHRSNDKKKCQAARKLNSCGATNPNRCSAKFTPAHAAGSSCDEYPFASTTEGQTAGVGGKTVSATRCVIAKQNSSQGGKISGFYRKMGATTQFDVVFKFPGAATGYCAAGVKPAAGCAATNGQM